MLISADRKLTFQFCCFSLWCGAKLVSMGCGLDKIILTEVTYCWQFMGSLTHIQDPAPSSSDLDTPKCVGRYTCLLNWIKIYLREHTSHVFFSYYYHVPLSRHRSSNNILTLSSHCKQARTWMTDAHEKCEKINKIFY